MNGLVHSWKKLTNRTMLCGNGLNTQHIFTQIRWLTLCGPTPALLDGLPPNLTWNLPAKQLDGTVKWPVCHAVEWLESLLDDQSRKHLPGVIFPKLEESDAAMCFRRMKRGEHLLGLEKIGYIVQHPWKFRNNLAAISPEKLKAILLWCRALQFALKKVEKNFSLDSVWLLVEWHMDSFSSSNI